MLLYFNRSFFRLVIHHYGSIFFRGDSLATSFFVAGTAAFLQYLIDKKDDYAPFFPHHFSMLCLGGVVGFAVIFRTSLGWSRYWEACSVLHTMYSKWCDTFMQVVAFASVTAEKKRAAGTEEGLAKAELLENAVEEIYRKFTTLSAMAADRLTHGDNARMEQRADSRIGAAWSDQLVSREALRGGPDLTGATRMPDFVEPPAQTKCSIRPTQIFERSHSEQELTKLPSSERRNLSKLFQSSVDVKNSWRATYIVRSVPPEGQMSFLKECPDRAATLMYLIIHDLAALSNDLDTFPPIQSRMYQQLSDGMLGLAQATKLSDVPFPFPYAQMLTLLLLCYGIFVPIYVVCFTNSMIVGPIMSFALFQGFWGLNETAKELENPFGNDANDIIIADFHMRFLDTIDQVFYACTLRSQARARKAEKKLDMRYDISEPIIHSPAKPVNSTGMAKNFTVYGKERLEESVEFDRQPLNLPSPYTELQDPIVFAERKVADVGAPDSTTESFPSCCMPNASKLPKVPDEMKFSPRAEGPHTMAQDASSLVPAAPGEFTSLKVATNASGDPGTGQPMWQAAGNLEELAQPSPRRPHGQKSSVCCSGSS